MDLVNIMVSLCESLAVKRLFSLAGSFFNIIKIVIPVIIIIMGSIGFIKAIISGNDEEMRKSEKNFFKKLIIGVAVFFVFPLVSFLMGLVNNSLNNLCITCFNEPGALTCKVESNTSDSANVKVNPNNKEEYTSKTGGK